MSRFDIAIVGAGIAGASLAAELGSEKSVLLLEAESQPGYHATGRSAAFWSETYGGTSIQPLTTASRQFLAAPPPSVSPRSFLKPRGALHIGMGSDRMAALSMMAEFAASAVMLQPLDRSAIAGRLPGRKPGWDVALWEPDCCDIDVGALHEAYLRAARRAGTQLACNAGVAALAWGDGRWTIDTAAGRFESDIIVNAAGAWADHIAHIAEVAPLGIQPFRRTMVQLQVSPGAPTDMPLVVGLDGSFYFKPEADGRVWLSPHDEIPSEPCDSAPEEIDVATAIARFEEVVEWKVERVEHKWAGLRSFAPDRLPIVGSASDHPAFFWLAGQGGFGIQTAPAIAKMSASLLYDAEPPQGIDPARYAPARFD
jgi:D-arginine dehydrogenase